MHRFISINTQILIHEFFIKSNIVGKCSCDEFGKLNNDASYKYVIQKG